MSSSLKGFHSKFTIHQNTSLGWFYSWSSCIDKFCEDLYSDDINGVVSFSDYNAYWGLLCLVVKLIDVGNLLMLVWLGGICVRIHVFSQKKICGSCLLGQSGLANTVRDWLKLTVVYWSFHHNTVWNTHFTLRKKVYSGPKSQKP